MSDSVADLLLKNRQEVFNERDPARRIAAVKSIYAKEAEIFEGNELIKGHDAISTKWPPSRRLFLPIFDFLLRARQRAPMISAA